MINLKEKKILVTGASGFLGTHIVEHLRDINCKHIIAPSSTEFDLTVRSKCREVVKNIDVVIHAAGRVGGAKFNREHPGELIYKNIVIGTELIEAARLASVQKFVAIGTICSYPETAPLPFREEDLWSGYPAEPTAGHGIVQRMMLTQLRAHRSQYGFDGIMLIPVNFYGPGDHLHPESIRLIPALIQKIVLAKKQKETFIEMTGNSQSTLDLLYIKDAVKGIVAATERYDEAEPVNLGSGQETSLRSITEKICSLLDFSGEIRWLNEASLPTRRLVDTSRAKKFFGFQAHTTLDEGLKATIAWYRKEIASVGSL